MRQSREHQYQDPAGKARREPVVNTATSGLSVVAIVDDDKLLRSTLAAMVQRQGAIGYGIDPDTDVVSAIEQIGASTLLLDLALGSNDAIQIMEELARKGYRGSIILISGRDERILNQVCEIGTARGLRMLPPLVKPIRAEELGIALGGAELVGTPDTALLFDVSEALSNKWLEVWYQPKVQLGTLTLVGAEALIRLRHPVAGLVGPSSFIPSSASDAYEAMTAFVVETVARDWRTLMEAGFRITASINASISMLQRPAFVHMIREAWPVAAQRPKVTVEVTEDEVTQDAGLARDVALQLKLYDVSLAIDDFGAGYSSFARLRDLPFEELKLDRSFVTGCGEDPKLFAFCQATVALASHFGVSATAEGIETVKDLASVRAAGFNIGQGYHFARPMPFEAFRSSLERRREHGRKRARAVTEPMPEASS